jgi:hypothetical protein
MRSFGAGLNAPRRSSNKKLADLLGLELPRIPPQIEPTSAI